MKLRSTWPVTLAGVLSSLAFAARSHAEDAEDAALTPALAAIRGDSVLARIKVLASDAFEGRAPGTPGEDKTVAYLTEQFKAMGLAPGNPDGTYIQDVPLLGFKATAVSGALTVRGKTLDLKGIDDWVAVSRRQARKVDVIHSEVVFVGYGVVAPEYGWDDYKGVDVTGKTLIMLVNDPPVPDPKDASKLDPETFKGKAMTYYGRWSYKYEIATEKGAAAALIIHEPGPAGYPYAVVQGWAHENFDIATPGKAVERVAIEGWLSLEKGKELLAAAGQDFDTLKKAAAKRDFRPVPLNTKADLSVSNAMREVKSRNVMAKLEGSDPSLAKEFVIYTAHWDHLGRDDALKPDPIFNGAADNASGTAALLEIAQAFTKVAPRPKRSILFLAVTAEEKGLLGAKFYATHPLYPLEKTLADLNMDVINLWGRTKDLSSLGLGQSTLDDAIADAAKAQGRVVVGDAEPEKGLFYRSDHFEFVKEGVPAVNARGGVDYVGRPAGYGRAKRAEYTKNDYHKVSDEVKPDWDLSGAVEDLRLYTEVGYRIAQGAGYPEWKPGAEFRARRQAMLQPKK